jgi:hypothetical protein
LCAAGAIKYDFVAVTKLQINTLASIFQEYGIGKKLFFILYGLMMIVDRESIVQLVTFEQYVDSCDLIETENGVNPLVLSYIDLIAIGALTISLALLLYSGIMYVL